jgi:hypothetical protein
MKHRDGGPAVIRADGVEEWWDNGLCVTEGYHEIVEEAERILNLDQLNRIKLDPPKKNTF